MSAAAANFDYANNIDFSQYITYLTQYAETWIPEVRSKILARAIDFQDAGVRVMLRNWANLMDEYDVNATRARIQYSKDMVRALDETDAQSQESARQQALDDYKSAMDFAETSRNRANAYKQVLDDLIWDSTRTE